MPEHEKPSCAIDSIANQSGRRICSRKSKRLYKCEKPAKDISACHSQNSTCWVDRILRKQKRSGQKIDDAHDSLNNRDESVNTGELYVPEWYRYHVYDREDDDDAEAQS